MLSAPRRLALATALLVPAAFVRAEAPADPAGHWEGAIHAPVEDVQVSVDLAFDGDGKLVGTFSNPGQRIAGYPLWSATVDGRSVKLDLKFSDAAVQSFDGELAADGRSMTGEFLISVYAVPFTLTRTGDAKIAATPKSPAIDSSLGGSVERFARRRRQGAAGGLDANQQLRRHCIGYLGYRERRRDPGQDRARGPKPHPRVDGGARRVFAVR